MIDFLASVDPMTLPLWAVVLFAASMYPMGFLFGVCSECCCSNATCDGFDLEEAYSHRHGGSQACEGFKVDGNEITLYLDFPYASVPIQKGCRVIGDGVPEGTKVMKWTRIWEGDLVLGPVKGCCRFDITDSFGNVSHYAAYKSEQDCEEIFETVETGNSQHSNYSWTECGACEGLSGSEREVLTFQTNGGVTLTLNNSIDGEPECLTFCGQSGLCGPFIDDVGYGPYGGGDESQHRNCVRWVCRCYEGTGKKGQVDENGEPLFPDPKHWYDVLKTTVVGGPTTTGKDLSAELTNALAPFMDGLTLEQHWLFNDQGWDATELDQFCSVYAFVFYGDSQQGTWDKCKYPFAKNISEDTDVPRTITSRDDYYFIYPCTRCV